MNINSVEIEILLYFLQNKVDSATIERIKEIIPLHPDWGFLMGKTISHGAGPLFYFYLEQTGNLPLIPPSVRQTFKRIYYQTGYLNLHKYDLLSRILTAIQKEGLEVMLIKGMALAQMVYKNVALRPMGDIDLIARSEEDEKKIKALASSIPHPLTLEVDYLPPDIIPNFWSQKKKVHFIEKLWERAVLTEMAEARVWIPCEEDFLLCLILNLSRKDNYYMRYLIDLSKFLQIYGERLSWESIMHSVSFYGFQRQSYLLFDFIQSILDESIPINVAALKNKNPLQVWEGMVWRRYKKNFLMAHIPGAIFKKIQTGYFLHPPLFPEREILAKIYHRPPESKYIYLFYFVRLYDLLWKYLRFIPDFLIY